MIIRGLAAAMNASGRFKYKPPDAAVDHLIIGGGVVGLTIAERLSKIYPHKSTYLVERHSRAGEEISSRNSEVIHAGRVDLQVPNLSLGRILSITPGIYYPPNSLKTHLCIQGRQSLYQRCIDHNIPHRRTGKLVVARRHQRSYLDKLVERVGSISTLLNIPPTPVEVISGDEARVLQPDLGPEIASALHSPATGIVDSHALMESFEKEIGESDSGELVYSTRVVRVDPYSSHKPPDTLFPDGSTEGWVVQTVTSPKNKKVTEMSEETNSNALLARVLINASGLNANLVLNSLLPPARAIPMYYARGSYAAYRGPGLAHISKLIYPVPDSAASSSGIAESFKFQSLGTHLTLDMYGNVRFGPDIEWLTPPSLTGTSADTFVFDEDAIDFWEHHLNADESQDRIEAMHRAVTSYLPGIVLKGLKPDYVGIRPKLVGPNGGFRDFQVRIDQAADFGGSGNAPMLSLLGIESPGLTASLAIGEYVTDYLERHSKRCHVDV